MSSEKKLSLKFLQSKLACFRYSSKGPGGRFGMRESRSIVETFVSNASGKSHKTYSLSGLTNADKTIFAMIFVTCEHSPDFSARV